MDAMIGLATHEDLCTRTCALARPQFQGASKQMSKLTTDGTCLCSVQVHQFWKITGRKVPRICLSNNNIKMHAL